MVKSTNLIYYVGGCYGTFVEWLCTYFSGHNIDLPFTKNGSSHNFHGNFLFPHPDLDNFISSLGDVKFARSHPNLLRELNSKLNQDNHTYYEIFVKDSAFIETHFAKTLVLHPTVSSALWIENNLNQRCVITNEEFDEHLAPLGYDKNFFDGVFLADDEKIKYALKNEIHEQTTMMWGKSSVAELDKWELREFMSYYWFNRNSDLLTCWDTLAETFTNVKFMSMDLLKKDPSQFFTECLDYFEVNHDKEKLSHIIQQWLPKQEHLFKDELVLKIANSVMTEEYFDWGDQVLTTLDEAFIQKLLADNNVKIQCYNLNKFPTNTKDFLAILE